MEKECSSYGTGFDAFVSVGGGDIKNDKLNVECKNANDDATARVYFVCCKPGDCDSCVDPVVSGSAGSSSDIATSTTTSTGTSGAAAVAGSVGAVAVLGAVSLVALKMRSERTTTSEMELHQVLQQDEIGNL